MMSVFFIGIGLASIATAFARTPLQIGIGLFVVGVFAAIYHPVGLAIVVAEVEEHRHAHRRERRVGQPRRRQRGADHRLLSSTTAAGASAFIVPGVVSIADRHRLRGADAARR